MSTKSEREKRRNERLEAEKREAAAQRRRLLIGYVVAGGLALAVVVGIVLVISSGGDDEGVDASDFPASAHIEPLSGSVNGLEGDERSGTPPPPIAQGDLETAAEQANCDLQLDLPDEGNTHIRPDEEPPEYKTNPATSGDHIVPPKQQADGAYVDEVAPEYYIHALEHGRIAIHYSPDLPESAQLELKGVFDEDPAGMLLFPDSKMPDEVAATAWTQLIACPKYEGATTLDALRAFRATYRGRGPENVPVQLAG